MHLSVQSGTLSSAMRAASRGMCWLSLRGLRDWTTLARSNGRERYLAQAALTYHTQLRELNGDARPPVSAYLTDHAVMDWDILGKYQIGYVSAPLQGDARFAGMLSIPYLTPSGVKGIKFRRITVDGPKYGQHDGQAQRLYNTQACFSAGEEIGISEGEIDGIVATERLGVPTVGVPGALTWKDEWNPVWKDFRCVLVWTDGDEPGRTMANRIAETIGWRAHLIFCPEGEDVASMVAAGRDKELIEQLPEREELTT